MDWSLEAVLLALVPLGASRGFPSVGGREVSAGLDLDAEVVDLVVGVSVGVEEISPEPLEG